MKFTPQKLYRINQYFWLLYPTKGAAYATVAENYAGNLVRLSHSGSRAWASYWSERLNCIVSFLNEGDVVMIVEVSGEQVKVINQEGVSGWISFPTDQAWAKGTITEAFNELP